MEETEKQINFANKCAIYEENALNDQHKSENFKKGRRLFQKNQCKIKLSKVVKHIMTMEGKPKREIHRRHSLYGTFQKINILNAFHIK